MANLVQIMKQKTSLCPCGSNNDFTVCCSYYLNDGKLAPSAEALMRSRYTAYTLLREDYLLATWHHSTRPAALGLADEVTTQWLGLDIKRHESRQINHAIVEFVARYKINGRAHRLHELSRFIQDNEQWFYVDGDVELPSS